MANRGTPNINCGKNIDNYGKIGLICSNPLITQEKTNLENPGPLQELRKTKGSDHIREILNPYKENLIMQRIGDR